MVFGKVFCHFRKNIFFRKPNISIRKRLRNDEIRITSNRNSNLPVCLTVLS
jgi:hypothetical protein